MSIPDTSGAIIGKLHREHIEIRKKTLKKSYLQLSLSTITAGNGGQRSGSGNDSARGFSDAVVGDSFEVDTRI